MLAVVAVVKIVEPLDQRELQPMAVARDQIAATAQMLHLQIAVVVAVVQDLVLQVQVEMEVAA
jgi:hypothetical protein